MLCAFEEGFFYHVMFGGHDTDGHHDSLWEAGLVLVNEEGRITLWDFWNDTRKLQEFSKRLYGIDEDNLTLESYIQAAASEPPEPKP
jgi:hypothetical protein